MEAIAGGAQGRRCRKADDGRGDAAAFAVYPAAVVGFQVQGGSTNRNKKHRRQTNTASV